MLAIGCLVRLRHAEAKQHSLVSNQVVIPVVIALSQNSQVRSKGTGEEDLKIEHFLREAVV